MTAPPASLTSYIPLLIRQQLATGSIPADGPASERLSTAVLYADVTGFTALAEQLSHRGPDGVEELTALLNAYFGLLIGAIERHGGDVVKFAGDALLACWPVRPEGDTLGEAALRALWCALEIQRELKDFAPAQERRLGLKIGISAGDVTIAHLGGLYRRREFVLHGAPLLRSASAENDAGPGQVIVDGATWALVGHLARGTALESGNVLLLGLDRPPAPAAPLAVPEQEREELFSSYIPNAVISRLQAGQTDWLAELRPVTVLFIRLPDLPEERFAEQAQLLMHDLQTAIYRYEGSINKLNIDDKGIALIAAFGLPPMAHEDDHERGTLAALAIQAALSGHGLAGAIGVASGRAFCGLVGSELRREYTIIGDVVNLSARLMQAAQADEQALAAGQMIFVDRHTAEFASERIDFSEPMTLTVKGKQDLVLAFRPQGEHRRDMASAPALIGRGAEQLLLGGQLRALRETRRGGVVIIEGEPGIGKSRLVYDMRRQAHDLQLTAFLGAGDAVERTSSYFAWRAIFSQLFDLEVLEDQQAQRAHVLDLLSDEPEWLRLAPLLNPVMPFELPDNELTAQMRGQLRATNTRELLIKLLKDSSERSPKLLILEDAHWLDSASWELAQAVGEQLEGVLLVIATRPLGDAPPLAFQRLTTRQRLSIQLAPLASDDALALARQRLGVRELPASISAFILDRADGHPFFTEELAYALRDSGVLLVEDGAGLLAEGVDLSAVAFPDTIQGVIISRIDKLPPAQQLTLKVASVIGRIFSLNLVRAVYPIDGEKHLLTSYLRSLERMNFTLLETADADLTYIFKHITIQEVAYNLMLFSQRRDLHRLAAEWYEQTYAGELEIFYPVLAYHWEKAEDEPRTLLYLDLAGVAALRGGTFHEAIGFFTKALHLTDAGRLTALQRAIWHRQIGEAYYGLGRLTESRQHIGEALALLGRPILGPTRQIARQLARQVGRQGWRLLCPQRPALAPAERERTLEQVRAYALMGEVVYFTGEILRGLTCAVTGLNLAEQLDPVPEQVRAYVTCTIAASLIPLPRLAERYAGRALRIAEDINQIVTKADAYNLIGVYYAGVGDWERADRLMREAGLLSETLGDRRQWITSHSTRAVLEHLRGNFEEAARLNTLVYTQARRSSNQIQQGWGLYSKGENLIRLGRFAEALALIEEARELVEHDIKFTAQLRVYAALAMARWRLGEQQAALEALGLLTARVKPSSANIYSALDAYSTIAEIALERLASDPASKELRSAAMHGVKIMRRYARLFPIGRSRAHLLAGGLHALGGKPSDAQKAFALSLTAARTLAMPYEEALALASLGHKQEALALFERLGAVWDAERVG